MKTILLILISTLPVILLGAYIYKKDNNKEPIGLLIRLLVGGVISTGIVLLISDILFSIVPYLDPKRFVNVNYFELFLQVFFGIAIIEEFSKWIMVYSISYKSKHFDEYYDIVLYAIFVSLGFALLENILYVQSYGLQIGLLRMVTTIPAHCFFGLLMGEYLGLMKISESNHNLSLKRKNMFLSIFLPTIAHAIYDFVASLNNQYVLVLLFAMVIIFGVMIIEKVNRISKLSPARNSYCTNCGNKVTDEYCTNCGKKR